MAVFRYRMQSILNLKQKMEDQAKMEFMSAAGRLREENAKLDTLHARLEAYLAEARDLRFSRLDVRKLKENVTAQERMKEYIKEQKICIQKAEEVLEQARVKLQEYQIERKTHEKLKENAFQEYIREENRRESKEVDELTSYQYGRKIT